MNSNIPIFFDRIGVVIWIIVVIDAIYQLYWKKERGWRVFAQLALGIFGLIVDGGLILGHTFGFFTIFY